MAHAKAWERLSPEKARELLAVGRLTPDHKLSEMLGELGMHPATLMKAMHGRLVPKAAAERCLDYLKRFGFGP